MTTRLLSLAAALVLMGITAALAVPACTIRLQQGNGDETGDRQVEPSGDDEQADPGGADLPSEDEPRSEDEEEVAAFEEVLARADSV